MKKIIILAAVLAAVMLMAGCQKEEERVILEETEFVPEGYVETIPAETETMTMHPTEAYSIPEGATGPGDVTMAGDDDYLPEGFKTEDLGDVVQVRFYYVNSTGLHPEFSLVEGTDCTPEKLIECLVNEGVLGEGTEVQSYEQNGYDAVVTLNWLVGCSKHATNELLAQAVANTFIDNLNLDTVTVKTLQDESYGPLERQ